MLSSKNEEGSLPFGFHSFLYSSLEVSDARVVTEPAWVLPQTVTPGSAALRGPRRRGVKLLFTECRF